MGLDLNFTTQLLLNRVLYQLTLLNHLDCHDVLGFGLSS